MCINTFAFTSFLILSMSLMFLSVSFVFYVWIESKKFTYFLQSRTGNIIICIVYTHNNVCTMYHMYISNWTKRNVFSSKRNAFEWVEKRNDIGPEPPFGMVCWRCFQAKFYIISFGLTVKLANWEDKSGKTEEDGGQFVLIWNPWGQQ